MLGVLLLCSLGAAAASSISGPRECAKGSEVWCRDLQAAAGCGAVGHCQRAVWSKPVVKSLPCDVCQDVVAAASNGMNPGASESDVLASVRKTCEWLPGLGASATCEQTVDAHSPAILGMLRGAPADGPAQLCTALTLCEPLQRHLASPRGPPSPEEASEAVAPFMVNGSLNLHPPLVPGGAVCRDCVRLVSRLQKALGSNLTLAEASAQAQCGSLGPGLAVLCKNYVRRLLVPAERTLRLLPPWEVCGKGGFCEELGAPAAPAAPVDGLPSLDSQLPRRRSELQMQLGLTCEVCLEVVQELDQWLMTNSTEAVIRQALERVCAIMPASMVQQCVTLVDTYSPSLVQLVTRVTPEKACTAIRLCGGRRRARAAPGAHSTPSPLLSDESQGSFCNGCKRLLSVSSRNLESRSTKRDILMAFKGGCSILPLPYLVQCNHFVTQYQPVLIESLKDVMDPEAACKKMGACHPPRTTLLGTDQCVMGPSFWCRSPETAEMCDATQHCRRFVWKETLPNSREHP